MTGFTFAYRDKDGVIRHKPIELPEFLSGIIAIELVRPSWGSKPVEGEHGKYLEICRIGDCSVHLPEGKVEHDDHSALENALSEEVNDAISRLPWTRGRFTKAEFQEWLASRKAAGAAIDIATCEVDRWHAYDLDPYGADPDLPEELQQIGTNRWVRSPESRGWVHEGDLPERGPPRPARNGRSPVLR